MMEILLYLIFFFIFTVLIQYLYTKARKKRITFWTGKSTVIVICILGLISKNINYLAAVIGFMIADELGRNAGWN